MDNDYLIVRVWFLENHSPWRVHRKSCSKNFPILIWKHLRRSLFFDKIADYRIATLWKKRLLTCIFLQNLRNFEELLFHITPVNIFWPWETLRKIIRIPEDLESCMTFAETRTFSYDLCLTGHLCTINGNIDNCSPE